MTEELWCGCHNWSGGMDEAANDEGCLYPETSRRLARAVELLESLLMASSWANEDINREAANFLASLKTVEGK